MAYEVFDNKSTRLGSPAVTLTADGKLALNADAGDLMKGIGAKFVHLLWDAEAQKIALRPLARSDSHSYKLTVSNANKRGMAVSAGTFLRYIGWTRSDRVTIPVQWNEKEKLLEATLPKEHDTKESKAKRKNLFI